MVATCSSSAEYEPARSFSTARSWCCTRSSDSRSGATMPSMACCRWARSPSAAVLRGGQPRLGERDERLVVAAESLAGERAERLAQPRHRCARAARHARGRRTAPRPAPRAELAASALDRARARRPRAAGRASQPSAPPAHSASTATSSAAVFMPRCSHRGPTISGSHAPVWACSAGRGQPPVDWPPVSLTIGIVGLPNVGKSTLFNALTTQRRAGGQLPVRHHRPQRRRRRRARRRGSTYSRSCSARRRSCRRPSRSSTSPASSRARARAPGSATSSWPTSARPTRSAR